MNRNRQVSRIKGKTVGIDLGTTNTAAAIQAKVLPLSAREEKLLPSVVAFPPSGATLLGTNAKRRRSIDPKNTIVSAKRLIGRKWSSPEVSRYRDSYSLELVETEQGGPAFRTRAGVVTPVQTASMLLTGLCQRADIVPAESTAVIAVPVMFREAERKATLAAAARAGFVDARLLDEPCASPLAHLTGKSGSPRRVAAYDFGGGTFDFAVLDCSTVPYEVLGFDGDLYLGGDDIDRTMADWVADEILKEHRWDLRSDREAFARLIFECERAKIRLATDTETTIDLGQVDPGAPPHVSGPVIARSFLDGLALELVGRTFIICDQVLHHCKLKAREIDAVFCAGGTTKLSMIREALEHYFGKAPRCDFDPLEVVSIGASLA